MYCSVCGAANPDGAEVKFCRSCGKEMAQAGLAPSFGQPFQSPPAQMQALPAVGYQAAGETAVPIQAAVFPYGGFWIRLVAYIIDVIILGILGGIIGASLGIVALFSRGNAAQSVEAASTLIGIVLNIAYFIALPPMLGATLGKLVLGLRIVDTDGRQIGFGKSVVRWLGEIVSALVFMLGFVWIGADANKQGWHDKIAGTYVVRKEFVKL